MRTGYAVAAFFGGWCGSVPFWLFIVQWILRLKVPGPPPPPEPWWIGKVLGAVGGVVTGYAYWACFGPSPEPWTPLMGAAVSSFLGFLGGRFVSELYGVVRSGRSMNVDQSLAAPQ